ncbi:MAG: FKBP-type peptidyl-prolyl cis-trans isomerase [Calditrichota bacterium]
MKTRWLVLLLAAVSSCQGQGGAAKQIKLETQMDKVSYAIGLDIGRSFKEQTMEINADALVKGIRDALAGGATLMTDEEVKTAMETWQEDMMNKMDPDRKDNAGMNKTEGETFLQENKTKEGVITLPSGLQYKVLKEGTGSSPKLEDEVVTHYQGRLINGKVFDSSYDRGEPISFPVNGVIAGWTEALQLMKEGSKWELFVPSNLAYGSRGAGPDIGPNATLIFEVELIKVK